MPSPVRPHQAGTAPPTVAPATGPRTEEETTTETTPTSTDESAYVRDGDPATPPGDVRPEPLAAPTSVTTPSAVRRMAIALALAMVLLVVVASPAYAATGGGTQSLQGLISNLTTWLVGILAGVATLFLTVGGLRYLSAGGDPGQVEKAKTALKSAAIGYALAALAPLIVSILASLFGG